MNTRPPAAATTGDTARDIAGDIARARRALALVGLGLPLLISAVAAGLIALWLPELPDPAAIHWSAGGVDGFGPPATFLWIVIGLGFGLPALLAGSALLLGRGQWGPTARFLGALALGLSGFSAVTAIGSASVQRGLSSAADAGDVLPVLLGALGALLVLSAAGWVLQPHVDPPATTALPSAPIAAIGASERVVWLATATMAPAALAVLGVAVVLLIGVTAVLALQATEMLWIPLLVLVIVGVAVAATASFRVRIAADGVRVRSQLGFPRLTVPLDEITGVRVVECHPMGEFGGYGWRVGMDGRTGIVLRTSPALEIGRRGRGALIITVDGADVGAATLQALQGRRIGRSRP
ncbi:DUF1648 domain-containing protein [Microbacterium sp. USHLN186]|uniref:DUF1648 domain-containing protein n=1 Tax=Microbacterium sp. USHLN186 TaxID=3081286 RepID=UPI0030179BCD